MINQPALDRRVGQIDPAHSAGEGYLGGGKQLSGSSVGDDPGAGRLEVDGGRLEGLRPRRRRLLAVDVCGHHGNGSLGRHHGDGDALAGGLDERQRLGGPHGAAPDSQLLQGDGRRDRQVCLYFIKKGFPPPLQALWISHIWLQCC